MNVGVPLCLCIDDVGLHPHVNEAALALLSRRRVQAVSCMTGAPAWSEAAIQLRQMRRGGFDAGLHLDFTAFPLIVPARRWLEVWRRGVFGRLDAVDLHAEITAQLDSFERHMGRPPDFVDGHQHVHQFPQIRDALIELMLRRCPDRRPWLRSTRSVGLGVKALLISQLGGRALMAQSDRVALRHNRALLGVYDFKGGPARYERLLLGWLKAGRPGDLLMCHPSRGRVQGDEIAQARVDEFEVLDGAMFERIVRSHQVRLLPMSQILDEREEGARARSRPRE